MARHRGSLIAPKRRARARACTPIKDASSLHLGTRAEMSATDGIIKLIDGFQSGYFNGTAADYCTEDAMFNPPGAPPMPIKQMLAMYANRHFLASLQLVQLLTHSRG